MARDFSTDYQSRRHAEVLWEFHPLVAGVSSSRIAPVTAGSRQFYAFLEA